jgi:hypothetical protein
MSAGAAYGGIFGNGIGSDVSGAGYFLFEGTGGSVAGTIMFQSPNFAVTQNTNYKVSFYLTNEDPTNVASLQPELDGQSLGSPVSAVGTWGTNGWQQFTFSWNSGSNTTAAVILNDLQSTSTGNDFGVDDISVSPATPEPATVALLGIGVFGLLVKTAAKRRHCG